VEAADDVGDSLAEKVNLWDEFFCVVDAGDEDLVFNCFGFLFCGPGEGLEAVDYVVAGWMLVFLLIGRTRREVGRATYIIA
jgi:hypothetical protein